MNHNSWQYLLPSIAMVQSTNKFQKEETEVNQCIHVYSKTTKQKLSLIFALYGVLKCVDYMGITTA